MKVVIIGGGQVGAFVASLFEKNNVDFVIIEKRKNVLEKLYRQFDRSRILEGSGSDVDYLMEAKINEADVLCAMTGSDEINLVASTIAKYEFGIKKVIARINNPRNAWVFDAGMGVDIAVNQAEVLAGMVVSEVII